MLKGSVESKDVPGSMDKAPSDRLQRPYVKAFRNLLTDPARQEQDATKWTPLPIMLELWNLWGERIATDGTFEQFRQKHFLQIKRLRHDLNKNAVRHPVLFMLIVRFLQARDIVPPPALAKTLREIPPGISEFIPITQDLPVAGPYKPGVTLYRLERDKEGPIYLAVRVPRAPAPYLLALVFDISRLEVQVGLYLSAARECFVRQLSTRNYWRYSLIDDRIDIEIYRDFFDRTRSVAVTL